MGQRALIVIVANDQAGERTEGAPATLYEVDLDGPQGNDVRRALRHHGANVGGGTQRQPPPKDAAAVRAWARKQDLPVSDRGRISTEIWRKYDSEVIGVRHDTIADAINEAAEQNGDNVVCLTGRKQ